ncbi:prepilin-type N-terminal cleavage/methylation domain-containing protein [Planctomycetota bacterium]
MRSKRKHHGFTLVEVVAALAIAGIALVSLLRLQLISVATANKAHVLAQATLLAQDKLSDLQTRASLAPGSDQGSEVSDAGTFHWRTTISPTQVSGLPINKNQDLQRVHVQIWWDQGIGKKQVELSALCTGNRGQ